MIHKHSLLCFLGILAGFAGRSTGHEAIIGGYLAGVYGFPYQVSFHAENHGLFCGGGIISEQLIVSAAHCFISDDGNFHKMPMVAQVGTNNLEKSVGVIIAEISRISVPKEFHVTNSNTDGDIALVKLKQPLRFSKRIKKLQLPVRSTRETYADKKALIAGWGWHWIHDRPLNTTGGHYDSLLRFADSTVLSNAECQKYFDFQRISEAHVCARVRQRDNQIRGVCIGDSGGPLVIDATIIIGIPSRSPKGCTERQRSSIYTRISYYGDFIYYVINQIKHDDIVSHEF